MTEPRDATASPWYSRGLVKDATATYRGYRKQALYALWRICTENDATRVYRPEGDEDLAIYDGTQAVVEVVQVKDYASPLSLSDFKPRSPAGYFARMLLRRRAGQACRHVVATFGPLGPELQGAIDGEKTHRQAVVQKLSLNPEISEGDATELLDALQNNIERPQEATLREAITQRLQDTIAGGDTASAIDLLMFWMFDAAEHQRAVTRDQLEMQLERIGEHVAQLRDGSAEWMTSVVPVRAESLTDSEAQQLRTEYRQGVHASWRHIAADADWPRQELLAEIHQKFQNHQAVIVHGASGQGKSSLAWRYLNDYAPDGLRFHVRMVDGRSHALRIAHILKGHAKTLRLPPIIYLDVAPADTGWAELVDALAQDRLRVLVTVREEDLTRARIAATVQVAEVALTRLSREDAEQVYRAITSTMEVAPLLTFDNAWAKFNAPRGGPLLEFSYLVAEGQELSARIRNQVLRLQLEAGTATSFLTAAHLTLLSLCAIANAADCRIDVARACAAVQLDPLVRPLALFENEYLLRVSDDTSTTSVGPLHAIRSEAVVDALLAERPEAWLDLAVSVLPLLVDSDIEVFLLTAFSRRPQHSGPLQSALVGVILRSWTQAAGIVAALLWQGVSDYERTNSRTIATTVERYGSGWYFFTDLTFGTADNFGSLREIFAKSSGSPVPQVDLPSREDFLRPLRLWLAHAQPPGGPPRTTTDWRSIGLVSFWLGRTAAASPLRETLESITPVEIPESVQLSDLATFISGQHELNKQLLTEWHRSHEQEIRRRFVVETESVHLEDDGSTVTALYVVKPTSGAESLSDVNDQTMRRVNVLRHLFPQREVFAGRGLGLEFLGELLDHDPTLKQIPRNNLQEQQVVQLNALIIALISYRHRRAPQWADYFDAAWHFRRTIGSCLQRLHTYWEQLISETPVKHRTVDKFPAAALEEISGARELPLLPRVVVDEWGFASETRTEAGQSNASNSQLWSQLQRFKPWLSTLRKYASGVQQIARQAEPLTVGVIRKRNALGGEIDEAAGRMLLVNLEAAWQEVDDLGRLFRETFGAAAPDAVAIETDEKAVLKDLWFLGASLANEPTKRRKNATAFLSAEFTQQRLAFLDALRNELSTILPSRDDVNIITDAPLDKGRALWVVCDHAKLRDVEERRERIVIAIWKACQSRGWRGMQWAPLVREWPKVLVVHLVQGKAVLPQGTRFSLMVLFASAENFEPKPHDRVDLPIDEGAFLAAGLLRWETPIVRAVLAWQAAISTFAIIGLRGKMVVDAIETYKAEENWLSHVEDSFTNELTTTHDFLNRCHEDLESLLAALAASPSEDAAKGKEWLEWLGPWPLPGPESAPGAVPTPSYVARFMSDPSDVLATVRGIVEWAIEVSVSVNRR